MQTQRFSQAVPAIATSKQTKAKLVLKVLHVLCVINCWFGLRVFQSQVCFIDVMLLLLLALKVNISQCRLALTTCCFQFDH